FIRAKNDPSKLKGFVNLTLGEPWAEDDGKGTDGEALYKRREYYDGEVPEGANVLTIGADVQDDRVEFSVYGWGDGEESWLIDDKSIYGDLTKDSFWTKLGGMFKQTYRKADGTIMDVRLACIDSGGHFTSEVYKFSKRTGLRFAIPIKGSSIMGKPVASFPRKRSKDGVYLTFVGTDTAKDLLYFRGQNLEPGAGYIHFPVTEWCSEDFFSQYAAEKRKKVYTKGKPSFQWVCKSGVRNEAWDKAVYALAAVRILQQNFGIKLDEQQNVEVTEEPVKTAPKKPFVNNSNQRRDWFRR
ncbi:MAG: terminase gpA endonuclease subunit, partial [Gallionellaceae bacterium]